MSADAPTFHGVKQAVNSILNYLNRLPPEDRVRNGAELERMTQTAGWQVFTDFMDKALDEARNTVEAELHEHTEYAAQHGRIRGLRFALSIPTAVIESGRRADLELQQIVARNEGAAE